MVPEEKYERMIREKVRDGQERERNGQVRYRGSTESSDSGIT
jgi:hypothetical protein